MLEYCFEPLPTEIYAPFLQKSNCVGSNIVVFHGGKLDLSQISIAIFGVDKKASAVRKELYSLQWRFANLKIIDLGNVVEAASAIDKQYAIVEIITELNQYNILPLVLGNSDSDVYPFFSGFANQSNNLEIAQVSAGIDLEESSVLRHLLTTANNKVFNMDFLGTQSYFISEATHATLEKMYFENYRLGTIRTAIEETEPIFRSANLCFFDLNSIKHSECGHTQLKSPNGLYSEEAAALSRYAGISNQLKGIVFYGFEDYSNATANSLLSQMIWYFFEGYFSRFNDHPQKNHSDFLVYKNKLNSTGHEIVFYKSKKSNRWWMEIPHPYDAESFFIGCSYADYDLVCKDEMPDRWWRAYQRLM